MSRANEPAYRERPILFSAPMVRALLDGRKTQTRRAMNPQPWNDSVYGMTWRKGTGWPNVDMVPATQHLAVQFCPYGAPGDRLWVRETWSKAKSCNSHEYFYRADGERQYGRQHALSYTERESRWRPSIHMPRWASRITLEITGVRVERLQDISEADAEAEGVESLDSEACADGNRPAEFHHDLCGNCGGRRLYDAIGPNMGVMPDTDCRECDTHVKRYCWLWKSINGRESWAANPWVWVVEFKRLEQARAAA